MLQLNTESLNLQPDAKVVRAEQYQAYLDARQVVARAEAEAERIREEARQEFERQKRQGYEDGMREAQAVMAEKMIDTVSRSVEFVAAMEHQVTEIVIQVLEKILGQFDNEELVVRAARTALEVVQNQTTVTLRVSPEQVPAVKARVGEILDGHPAVSMLDVQPDSRLKPDGCILESDIGVVDASLDIQLEAIKRAMRRAIHGK